MDTAEKASRVAGSVRDLDEIIAYCQSVKADLLAFADDGFLATEEYLEQLDSDYDDLTGNACHLSPHSVVDSVRSLIDELLTEGK